MKPLDLFDALNAVYDNAAKQGLDTENVQSITVNWKNKEGSAFLLKLSLSNIAIEG
tara:strand:- start:384 stop:551 length:168 start_codon:yes stop_codon:yes gene_type:complete